MSEIDLKTNFQTQSDETIKAKMQEWTDLMFNVPDGKANPNSVLLYSPLIQMLGSELSGRYVKRTTNVALGVAALSLIVSCVALYVSMQ